MSHLEQRDDGTTVLMDGERVLYVYYDGCAFCDREKAKKRSWFPQHKASRNCESGSEPHCTCDMCF